MWNDKFPPLNLYNYPMKLKENYIHGQVFPLLGDAVAEAASPPQTDRRNTSQLPGAVPYVGQGTKFDATKPRLDLVDFEAVEGLAKVLTFGAQKYAAHNWRGGLAYGRIISSLLRHLSAIQRGEDVDPESGLPHIDHVGCNWMFLSYFMKHRPDLDDRWKAKEVNEIK